MDALDLGDLEDEIMEDIEAQLESVRAMAEAHAHKIMPKRGGRLCEIKKIDGSLYIVMTAHGAHIDEFGSVYQPPNAPLRKALDAAGLKFKLIPKS